MSFNSLDLMDADIIQDIDAQIKNLGRNHGVLKDVIQQFRRSKRRYDLSISSSNINPIQCEALYNDLKKAIISLIGSSDTFDVLPHVSQVIIPDSLDALAKDDMSEMRMATAEEIKASGKIDDSAIVLKKCPDGRGIGAFAKKSFAKGDLVASYGGVFECNLDQVDMNSRYRIRYSSNLIVDGNPRFSEVNGHKGNYFNDARGPTKILDRNNTKFMPSYLVINGKRIRTIWLVATQTINPDDEVCVFYGRGFWNFNK